MLLPGLSATAGPRPPRELTFVIDTSGSMAGTAIAQARAALLLALERLAPGDRFNVIELNSRSRALFAVPLPVDPATIGRARSFVQGLRADGGTEMREALALAFAAPPAPGVVRQVVFLTDGAVGNEDELLRLIRDRLGERRLFTVGIGGAPNSHFMAKAAQFGRGSSTSIGDLAEVQTKMSALFRKLESPVLTDIAISWPAGSEAWPAQVPDLYAGEPIVATAALPALAGEIVVTGTHAGAAWQARLPLAGHGDAQGVGALWARARIDALMDRQREGAEPDAIRAEVVRVALAHHLVSRYTSLVAVDVTPSAPAGMPARRSAVAGNLPEGQVHEAIFGGLPQTATPASLGTLLGIAALLLAAALARATRRAGVGC
jgi:Ca-activated chloride channel family protein